MLKKPPQVILLVGPTASGKSTLAMRLAEQWPIELISVDSAQVYREMDIGTAKPSLEERNLVPHHLIDICDPTTVYSAARFREDALAVIAQVHARGAIPVLVGGTMLYVQALVEGISDLPPANPEIRAELDQRAAREGWWALHQSLVEIDPVTAARLDPNDRQRIQRALEVFALTGSPLSSWQGKRQASADYSWVGVVLLPSDRALLHQRIAARFQGMLQAGLVDEVEGLWKNWPLNAEMPSMRCVGYRQVLEYLQGKISEPELRERGIFATRQLAKRQITWLRKLIPIHGWKEWDCTGGELDLDVYLWLKAHLN